MLSSPLFKDKLDFRLPEFTRVSWVSDDMFNEWSPRIQRINSVWSQLEWQTVAKGLRKCAIVTVTPAQLVEYSSAWVKHGLANLPHEIYGQTNNYSSTPQPANQGEPIVLRVAIGKPQDLVLFQQGIDDNDDLIIGELLGFPQCCSDFFKKVWCEEGCIDTSWAMAVNTIDNHSGDLIEIQNRYWQTNILWRWLGLRAVWHLPCSFHCDKTIALADIHMDFAKEIGFSKEIDWLREILSWPVQWSSLHGIAEIKNPLTKISAVSDATGSKYTVRLNSQHYPHNGISGLNFPYRQFTKKPLTKSVKFQRGIDNQIPVYQSKPSWFASDNGFNSITTMQQAHQPIIETVENTVNDDAGTILDLGCGNGALLKSIAKRLPHKKIIGIDQGQSRIDHAKLYQPIENGHFIVGNIFLSVDSLLPYNRIDLCLLMPGRLLEVDKDTSHDLMRYLAENCDSILIYAYGDWLTKYSNLEGLINQIPQLVIKTKTSASTALALIKS